MKTDASYNKLNEFCDSLIVENVTLKEEKKEQDEKFSRIEKLLEEFVNRCGENEVLIRKLSILLDKKSFVYVFQHFDNRGGALDNLHNRVSLLEANMLPNSMLNKQHLMRMLGLNEEFITKKLLEGGTESGKEKEA